MSIEWALEGHAVETVAIVGHESLGTPSRISDIGATTMEGVSSVALISIAISLKRIADVLEGVPYDNTPGADNSRHSMGVVDGIMHAIEQSLLAASQRG